MPKARTIPGLLAEITARFPERTALIAGDQRVTYSQLAEEVARFSRALLASGIQPGDRVAILMGNRPEWIVAALATCSIGGTMLGVNTWSTPRELEYILSHSEATMLVSCDSYLNRDYVEIIRSIAPRRERLPKLREIVLLGEVASGFVPFASFLDRADDIDETRLHAARAAVTQHDVGYLLYTSGSTSMPKGVQILHGPLIENMWHIGQRMRVTEHDVLWLAVSLFWGLGCENALFNVLTHGATMVLQESFEPGEALRLIETHRCTLFYAMSNMAQSDVDHPERANHDLTSLRSGLTTGTPEQIRRVIDMGPARIANVYGMTEGYGNSNVTDDDDPIELRLTSVGRPLPGIEQRIVDPNTDLELPSGQVGEIRMRGRITIGYFKDPAQTAAAFDADGFFKTGDLGHKDEAGNLYFHCRLKEMIKTGGINVSPAEVEEILMRHPDILQAYCIGVPDPAREELLVALIVPRDGARLHPESLTHYCRTHLAVYKVPRKFRFAAAEELPMTATGKLKKNALAEMFFLPRDLLEVG